MSTTAQKTILQRLADFEPTGEMPVQDRAPVRPARQMDGYTRRTPVQVTHTDEGYHRDRRRRVLRSLLLVCCIALVIIAIIRSGLLRV